MIVTVFGSQDGVSSFDLSEHQSSVADAVDCLNKVIDTIGYADVTSVLVQQGEDEYDMDPESASRIFSREISRINATERFGIDQSGLQQNQAIASTAAIAPLIIMAPIGSAIREDMDKQVAYTQLASMGHSVLDAAAQIRDAGVGIMESAAAHLPGVAMQMNDMTGNLASQAPEVIVGITVTVSALAGIASAAWYGLRESRGLFDHGSIIDEEKIHSDTMHTQIGGLDFG